MHFFGCFYKRHKAKDYRRMLAQSKARLKRSLDLRGLIESQEFVKMAFRVLLTARQIIIVEHISRKNLSLRADKPDEKEAKKAQVRDENPKERLDSLIECLAASDDILDRRLCQMIDGQMSPIIVACDEPIKDPVTKERDITSTTRKKRKDISSAVFERDKLIETVRIGIDKSASRNDNVNLHERSTVRSFNS